MTTSSKAALDWASYFAARRIRSGPGGSSPSQRTTVDSLDLLLGLLFAHPDDSEPLQLLSHFEVPLSWLQEALPDDRRLDLKSFPQRKPARRREIDFGPIARIAVQARDLAEQHHADNGLVRNRDLFGALIQASSEQSTRVLDGLLVRRLAPVRMTELASEYAGFVDDSLSRNYGDFLKERHPWTSRSQAIATYDADSVRAATERSSDEEPPLPQDFVDIGREIEAFAYLVTARALVPPLAVGLFGDWGSGKSFFMQALQRRVDRITDAARKSGKPQRELPIHKSVVQIQFNAWHYVEGNLWASLVDHIFSNLRSSPSDRPSLLEKRRLHVTEKMASAELARHRVELEVKAEQQRLDAARAARLRLENEQAAKRAGLETQAAAAAAALEKQLSDDVVATLKRLGYPGGSLADFAAAIADARATYQRGTGLVGRFQESGWRWVGAILAVVALGPILSFVMASANFPVVTTAFTSVGAVLGGLTVLIKNGTEWTKKRLEQLEDAEQKILEQKQKLDQARLDADKQLDSIQADLQAKREEEQALAARVRELQRELESISPAKVLSDFIDARIGSEDYRKHLGLTALVRRDFEDLWQLVAREEADFVKNDTGASLDTPMQIGRIVLYIDDLDRCPPQVVVNVLQAVHLLLAFPLFVVVVAVDARWLSSSLEKHYGELLARPRSGGSNGNRPGDQASPDDYLEKIFQIPFWVRRLNASNRARIVQGLVGPSLTIDGGNGSGSSDDDLAAGGDADDAAIGDLVRALADQSAGEPSLSPRSLEITPRELAFMNGLAGLLGDSPRAVKRFVNAYRLMKSLAEGRDQAFTSDLRFAGYQIVLLLLAMVTGMPESSPKLFRRVRTPDPAEETLGQFATNLGPANPEDSARLTAWLAEQPGWDTLQLGKLATWSDDIARFSFRTEVS
jgi:hypothetical protein